MAMENRWQVEKSGQEEPLDNSILVACLNADISRAPRASFAKRRTFTATEDLVKALHCAMHKALRRTASGPVKIFSEALLVTAKLSHQLVVAVAIKVGEYGR